MHNVPDADPLADYPQQVVFQVLLANNLTSFTEFAFGVVRPGVLFKPNWHFEAVTEKLSQVANGDVRRLIITLPPRTLKSLCASVALPAWFLGRHPWERVVVVSYSDFLARSHANDFRRLVSHPIYQASFPAMRLERDTDREITTTKRRDDGFGRIAGAALRPVIQGDEGLRGVLSLAEETEAGQERDGVDTLALRNNLPPRFRSINS
jgi:hypothetical protein